MLVWRWWVWCTVLIVAVALAAVVVWDEGLAGQAARGWAQLHQARPASAWSEQERLRWDAAVEHSFPGAQAVEQVTYDPLDDAYASTLIQGKRPVVIKESVVTLWPALSRWSPDYVAKHLPYVDAHAPTHSVVRMHFDGQPWDDVRPRINWTRPWREQPVSMLQVLGQPSSKLVYCMLNVQRALPDQLHRDVLPYEGLSLPWKPPLERNLWFGTPTVSTPTHYDLVHNFYAQVVGQKRFILFPPRDHSALHPFSRLHPSARASQIDLNNETNWKHFEGFPSSTHAQEVVLSPGDVLYIPPYWFHHVAVVGSVPSISVSTHSESSHMHARTSVIEWSLRLPVHRAWPLVRRVNACNMHITSLFTSSAEVVTTVNRILRTHFDHTEYDYYASELHTAVLAARKAFPSVEVLHEQWTKGIGTSMQDQYFRSGFNVRERLFQEDDEIVSEVQWIMLDNYIMDTCGYFVGAENVDPFLRMLLQEHESGTSMLSFTDAPP